MPRTEDDLRAVYVDPPGIAGAEDRLRRFASDVGQKKPQSRGASPVRSWTGSISVAAVLIAAFLAITLLVSHGGSAPSHLPAAADPSAAAQGASDRAAAEARSAAAAQAADERRAQAAAAAAAAAQGLSPTGTSSSTGSTSGYEFRQALTIPGAGTSAQSISGFRIRSVPKCISSGSVTATGRYQRISYVCTETKTTATVFKGDKTPGTVYLFYAGAFDPSTALTGQATTVNGVQAYWTTTPSLDDSIKDLQTALVWRYAPNAWAMVATTNGYGTYPSGTRGQREHEAATALGRLYAQLIAAAVTPAR